MEEMKWIEIGYLTKSNPTDQPTYARTRKDNSVTVERLIENECEGEQFVNLTKSFNNVNKDSAPNFNVIDDL